MQTVWHEAEPPRISIAHPQVGTCMMDVGSRRKYRKSESDLLRLRRVVGFWEQASPFCKGLMPPQLFCKFEEDLRETERRDEEIIAIVELQPTAFALSQLKTLRDMAMRAKLQEDKKMAADMEQQYAELRERQFRYFETGLRSDWSNISNVRGALAEVANASHLKKIAWLREKAQKADVLIEAHMVEKLTVHDAENIDDAIKAVVNKMKHMQREDPKKQDPLVLGMCDFNTPHSTYKETVEAAIAFIGRLTAENPEGTAVVVTMPDRPKDGSKRGLADEEGPIEKELWMRKLWADRRWIMPFNLPKSAANHSNMRRWTSGRMVVETESKDSNTWLLQSELSLAGRPLAAGVEIGELPLQRDLVLLESVSPNEDLRTADRQRPSPEQVVSQKGAAMMETLLQSALADMDDIKNRPVLVVNVFGFIEDIGVAVAQMQRAYTKMRYLSFNLGNPKARLTMMRCLRESHSHSPISGPT